MSPSTGPRLPARSIGDEALAAALAPGGCPLCRVRLRSAERFLGAVLYESVNDRGFRAEFEDRRGFCRLHARQALSVSRTASGSSLGAAILFGATIAQRAVELEAVVAARGRGGARRMLDAANRQADCPVCERVATTSGHSVDRLLALSDDPAWHEALKVAELCSDDLVRLWRAADARKVAAWAPVAQAQLARVAALARRLGSFAHHSSHDRRHLMTDDERGAADDAARFLGGDPAA
jgi:hypothetical protein